MDGPEGKERPEVFVSSFHGVAKNRKSRTPTQTERSPSRRNSREPLNFPLNTDRCGVLPVSELDFGLANLRGGNFPINHHAFPEEYASWIFLKLRCRIPAVCFLLGPIGSPSAASGNPYRIKSGVMRTVPPKRRIPGVKHINISF
jgi:hypothetical protein